MIKTLKVEVFNTCIIIIFKFLPAEREWKYLSSGRAEISFKGIHTDVIFLFNNICVILNNI